MGIQSNYLEAAVADAILSRSAAIPSPATLYFALFTAMPDENGLNGQEVVAGSSTGYQRKPVANTNDEFPPVATWARSNVVDKGVKYNVSRQNNSIAFPPALSDWGDVVGFGIYDALTGGNLLISSTLDTTRTVARNDTMRFVDRELRFTEFGQVPDNILSFFMQRVVLDTLFGRSADYVTASATDVYFSLFTQMPEADEQGYAVEVQCDITSGTKKVTMSISTAKGIKEGMVVRSVAGSTASVPDKTYVVSVGTDNVVELSSPVSLSTI